MQAVLPPHRAGATRHGPGARRTRSRHELVHHLPARLPARLRRDRALRRQLRDRQLALDHDRAADARARDDAHARREPPPGADVDHRRGARDRRARVGRRALPRPRARQGALQPLRRWSASRCRTTASPSRRARSSSRSLVGVARRAAREPASRDPRDACAADRRRARGGDAAAVALRALPHARVDPAHRRRVRRAPLRALRQRAEHDGDPAVDGHRRAADLLRRRDARRAHRAAVRAPARLAGDEDRRRRRLARARQRAPQPAAHRVDRIRADDRARARDARRGARGRDHAQLPRRRRQDLAQRRLRDHGAEQLQPDSADGRRTPRRRARSSRPSATFAPATPPRSATSSSRLPSTRPRARCSASTGAQGSQQTMAQLGDNGAFVDKSYAKSHNLQRGLAARAHLRERRAQDVRRQGHLRSAERRLAVRPRDDLAASLGRAQREPAQPLHLRPRPRRPERREPEAARADARRASRTRRCRRGSSSSTTRSAASARS